MASLSGIKSNPAAYTDFARFNSYMDAFKNFFPEKVRTKETLTKLTLVSSRPFHGHTGRSYKMTIGDLSGSVHAFVTKKRFYAIVSLNTKKDEALEEKFISSFVLPERQIEQPKVASAGDEGQTVNAEEPTIQRTKSTARGGARSQSAQPDGRNQTGSKRGQRCVTINNQTKAKSRKDAGPSRVEC